MSLIRKAGKVLDAKYVTRELVIVPADKDLGVPDAKVTVRYINEDKMRDLSDEYRTEGEGLNISKAPKFKGALAKEAVCGLSGFTATNIRRMCEVALANPEYVADVPEEGLQFDPNDLEDVEWIFTHMDATLFVPVFIGVQDLQSFASAKLREEKNASAPLSDSQ